MSTVVAPTSPADIHAVEAVKNHHARLAGALAVQVEALLEAADRGALPGAASKALVRWCDAELIPHAPAEEQGMYRAAHEDPRGRLLVDAMLAEHRDLVALVEAVRQATSPVRAAANAQALRSLFESHLVKENEQILPLLAESGEVSTAVIFDGLHELLGGQDHEYAEAAAECGCGGECGCGHQHPADLDAPWEGPAR
jgi:hemerythrin-like domain-containing protein